MDLGLYIDNILHSIRMYLLPDAKYVPKAESISSLIRYDYS